MLTLAFWVPGPWEGAAILIVGLLLFGRRLPEVGRSVGRSIVEFKKGVKGIEDEIDGEVSRSESEAADRRRLTSEELRRADSVGGASGRTVPMNAGADEGEGEAGGGATTSPAS